MTYYKITPAKLSGSITAPPSKSHCLRAILFASMANGKSIIYNYLYSPDIHAMIEACKLLGARIDVFDRHIEIIGVAGKPQIPDNIIDAGNSGQVLRFIAAIAALLDGYTVITGDQSIRQQRPIQPLLSALNQLGGHCVSTKSNGHAPVIIKGPIKSGNTNLDGQDSQPVSALLIACAFLANDSEIHVNNPGEKPWIELTLWWLNRLGIQCENQNYQYYRVTGNNAIEAFEFTVPGDFSSIAYPLVACLLSQQPLVINNLDPNDVQGDKALLELLQLIGAKLFWQQKQLHLQPGKSLQGSVIDINNFIDAITILAVVGCYAQDSTQIYNASIARQKESNRVQSICLQLQKMGAKIEETHDGLIVHPSNLHGAELNSCHDHRIAMALSVAACVAQSESYIRDIQCIKKSYPDFYTDMCNLGANIEVLS